MAEVTRKGFKDKNGNKVSLIAKVINAITGHFAGLNNKGEVVDSGYGPSDFAQADHEHKYIFDKTQAGENAKVVVYAEGDGDPQILLSLRESSNSQPKTAIVDLGNMDNLKRALKTPSSAPEDDDTKLITSKAVYDALREAEGLTVDDALSPSSTNPVQNKEVWAAINEVNEKIDIINRGSIYIERDMNDGSFPIAGENSVKAGLESFINNHPEGVTFIEMIYVNDLYNDLYFYPTASISWERRQLTPTKIDVEVYIGGTKKLTATATVPADSLDTITWNSVWDIKDYSSSLSIVSNS